MSEWVSEWEEVLWPAAAPRRVARASHTYRPVTSPKHGCCDVIHPHPPLPGGGCGRLARYPPVLPVLSQCDHVGSVTAASLTAVYAFPHPFLPRPIDCLHSYLYFRRDSLEGEWFTVGVVCQSGKALNIQDGVKRVGRSLMNLKLT